MPCPLFLNNTIPDSAPDRLLTKGKQVTHANLQNPIYSCDEHVSLDCKPDEMWDLWDEKPWSDSICQVVSSHIDLDTKGKISCGV